MRAGGMTLVEIVVATAVLTIGTLGFSAAVLGSMRLDAISRERRVARAAAEKQLETLQAMSPQQLLATSIYSFPVQEDATARTLPPAPPPGESPPRTGAGRVSLTATLPDVSVATISVRWLAADGKPRELVCVSNLSTRR